MKNIIVVSKDTVLIAFISKIFDQRYNVVAFKGIESALDFIYNTIPALLIVRLDLGDNVTMGVLGAIKEDPIFSQVPVMAVFGSDDILPEWDMFFVDDYIRTKELEREMTKRVELCITRSEKIVEINPLTRLPGNISINKQIQARLDSGESFGLAYLDINQFKPFNDKYGFTRGDEAIKVVGRLLLNIVKNKQIKGSFVGHIGGDDFVYIMDMDLIEKTSEEIIDSFNSVIGTFYDPGDKSKGFIESVDRHGALKTFPIMTLSIGIANSRAGHFSHYGEITEIASKMKSYAKHSKGNCFKVDRRRRLD